jgi:predicted outer membrane protein
MTKFIAPAMLALAAMASQALAQSATETQRPAGAREGADRATTTQSQAGSQGQQGDKLAKHVAVCLTLGNMEEIQLGQFAQDRAQNPQVKQFAQTMVEEHQQAVQKLQQAMPEVASLNLELNAQGGAAAGQSTAARPGAGATASTSANQRSSATGAQSGGQEAQKMVQFAREVKQECLNLTTQELGRKQGMEFDKAYIGQQIVAHTGMLAELKTAQRHLQNQQLRPIIQEGTQMTEHHLAQARQIMEQLDAGGQGQGAGQAQRPESPPTPRR